MQFQRVVSQFLTGVPNIVPTSAMIKEHNMAEGHFLCTYYLELERDWGRASDTPGFESQLRYSLCNQVCCSTSL